VLASGGFGMQVGAVAGRIHGEAGGAQFIDPIDGGAQFRKVVLAAGGSRDTGVRDGWLSPWRFLR
jgi:hypothetical protein